MGAFSASTKSSRPLGDLNHRRRLRFFPGTGTVTFGMPAAEAKLPGYVDMARPWPSSVRPLGVGNVDQIQGQAVIYQTTL